MAKNTNNTDFRNIDIDAYGDNNYDGEGDDKIDSDEKGPDELQIKRLLEERKNVDALNMVLKSAPLNTKNTDIKDSSFQVVVNVLRSFQNVTDIDNAVKSLDVDLIDVLMKYIYRGFDKEPKFSNMFLNWHEKVYAIGGTGCIVRVLSDRRRV